MKLLVGCPVLQRAWIMDDWFAATAKACANAGVEPHYVFVLDPHDPTNDVIDAHSNVKRVFRLQERDVDVRVWNPERFEWMVHLRNALLEEVREQQPEYFLSLDSDILLHPDALVNLFESIEKFDAVGGKTYMSTVGVNNPSYFKKVGGGFHRTDQIGVFPVDVIMAIKLMTPAAYNIDYVCHDKGEDIGFSLAAKSAGLKLGFDGRLASKHVMKPPMLERVDQRCGF